MGHIWLIYGLYMDYLWKHSMIEALQRLYEYLIM
jgi:hypothetical protein